MNARAAAVGVGYQLWLRSRWVVIAALAWAAALAIAVRLLPSLETARVLALVGMFPVGVAVAFLIGVFSYSGDLGSRESNFPRHMLALPLSARTLALAPVWYGVGCLSAVWLVFACLVLRPAGLPIPPLAPMALIAAVLTWLQATCWMPFWFAYARLAALAVVVSALVAFEMAAHFYQWPEPVVIGGLLGAIALAMAAAVGGVSRARRGAGTTAPWASVRSSHSHVSFPPAKPFTSGERAQIWMELRLSGPMLAVLMLAVPLFTLVLLLFQRNPGPLYLGEVMVSGSFLALIVSLAAPVFLAGIVGGKLGKTNPWAKSLEAPAFLAARPMNDTTLVAAKLKATGMMVAAIWAALLVILAATCLLPHSFSPTESVADWFMRHASGRDVLAAGLGLGGLALYTWTNIVQGIAVPLSGRAWLNHAMQYTVAFGFGLVWFMAAWAVRHPEARPALLLGTRVTLWVIVAAKVVTAIALVRAVVQTRIASVNRVVIWTLAWLVGAAAIYAAVLWLIPPARHSKFIAALILLLALPYNRIIGMPFAWNRNRHR